MDFAFSEQQEALRQQARKTLAAADCTEAIRRCADADRPTFDEDLWHQLCELKWSGMRLPDPMRGAGKGALELCVLAEEIGYALAPVPILGSAFIAAATIAQLGSAQQHRNFLPALAQGESIACLVFNLRQTLSVVDGQLSGIAAVVTDAPVADIALVVAPDGGQSPDLTGIYLVDLSAAGVTRRNLKSIDLSHSYAELSFTATPVQLLASGNQATAEFTNRAAIITAFSQLGSAQRCLDLATEYAKRRFQFGRPIGSFQALQQKLAALLVEIELARANCYYGAWALTDGDEQTKELAVAACLSRISATEALNLAAQECVHVHGGRGFTWDADPQLFLRRSRAVEAELGGVASWQEKLLHLTMDA